MNRKQTRFCRRVYRFVKKVPRGRVATYAQVARRTGFPRAARAVGNALNRNLCPVRNLPRRRRGGSRLRQTISNGVPCHRVVRSDGRVGGFARGARAKITMLGKEGVEVKRGKVDLKEFG